MFPPVYVWMIVAVCALGLLYVFARFAAALAYTLARDYVSDQLQVCDEYRALNAQDAYDRRLREVRQQLNNERANRDSCATNIASERIWFRASEEISSLQHAHSMARLEIERLEAVEAYLLECADSPERIQREVLQNLGEQLKSSRSWQDFLHLVASYLGSRRAKRVAAL